MGSWGWKMDRFRHIINRTAMKEKIPVWVYLLTIVLLIAFFIVFTNWKQGNSDEKILQLRDSVAIFDERARNVRHQADSTEFLATVFDDISNQIAADTIYITIEHEKIRYSISNLDANGGLGLLAKNLQRR